MKSPLYKSQMDKQEAQFHNECVKAFRKADFGRAKRIAKTGLKHFPKSNTLLFDYASAVGDDEKGKSKRQRELNRKKASRILNQLLKRLNGQSINLKAQIRNEYYWFSAQPLKQYKLGVELVKKGHLSSYYSQGVGSVMMAQKYKKAKNTKRALKWALIAEKAWVSYIKHFPSYYNAYCWYATALGLLGKLDQMEKALEKASKISGKHKKYFEFEEIRKLF